MPTWRSDKHRAQWLPMLTKHVKQLANKVVSEITAEHIVQILKPLWLSQPDLALRLRERIEKVLDWAKVHEHREGENPAAWKGNLRLRMPPLPPKHTRVQHMMRLPYDEMPAFMAQLRALDDSLHRARALQFTILTVARRGETFGASGTRLISQEGFGLFQRIA